jgi:hypothetical protein
MMCADVRGLLEAMAMAAAGHGQHGFRVAVRASGVAGAGRGLFVESGLVRCGDAVALFPGVVFTQQELALASSLGVVSPTNEYLAAFAGGTLFVDANLVVDGSPSSRLFVACRARFLASRRIVTAPTTPISLLSSLSFAVAHFANHQPPTSSLVNAKFADVDFAPIVSASPELAGFVPNAAFTAGSPAELRGMALVATRDIAVGNEVFVDYSFRPKQGLPAWVS